MSPRDNNGTGAPRERRYSDSGADRPDPDRRNDRQPRSNDRQGRPNDRQPRSGDRDGRPNDRRPATGDRQPRPYGGTDVPRPASRGFGDQSSDRRGAPRRDDRSGAASSDRRGDRPSGAGYDRRTGFVERSWQSDSGSPRPRPPRDRVPPIRRRDLVSRAASRAMTTIVAEMPEALTPVVQTMSAVIVVAHSDRTHAAASSIAAVRGPAPSAATTRAATHRAATDRARTTRPTTVRAATHHEATARVPTQHAAVNGETIARAVMTDATTHRARTSDAVTARVGTASAVDTSVRTISAGTPRVIVGPPNRPTRRAGVRAPHSAVISARRSSSTRWTALSNGRPVRLPRTNVRHVRQPPPPAPIGRRGPRRRDPPTHDRAGTTRPRLIADPTARPAVNAANPDPTGPTAAIAVLPDRIAPVPGFDLRTST